MLEHFRYYSVDEGSDVRFLSRRICPLRSKDALARAQEPKVLLRYGSLQPFYRFVEALGSLFRLEIPQAWLVDPPPIRR